MFVSYAQKRTHKHDWETDLYNKQFKKALALQMLYKDGNMCNTSVRRKGEILVYLNLCLNSHVHEFPSGETHNVGIALQITYS